MRYPPYIKQAVAKARPIFSILDFTDNGVGQLNPLLTINSKTVEPLFRYKGGDATSSTWPAWGYGQNLDAAGSAGSFNTGSPCLGANDDSVDGDGTRYYTSPNAGDYSVNTDDIVFEVIFKHQATTFVRFYSNYNSGTKGLIIGNGTSTSVLRFYISDGTNTAQINTAALTDGAWYHAICFVDRSGSGQWYINGAVSAPAVDCSSVGDPDNTSLKGGLLADPAGTQNRSNSIAYMALWRSPGWLDTHLQATIAQTRFAQLNGTYANAGTDRIPTFTRAGTASLTNGAGTFTVGANWPRVETAGLLIAAAVSDSDLEYDLANPSQGSIVGTFTLPDEDTSTGPQLIQMHDGTTDNTIEMLVDAATDSGFFFVQDETVTQASITGTTDVSDGTEHTLAGSFGTDDFELFIDQTSEGTPDTSGSVPTTTKISIGADQGGTSNFEGHIKTIKVFSKTRIKT